MRQWELVGITDGVPGWNPEIVLGEPTDEPRGLIQIQPGWVGLQFVDSRERAGDATFPTHEECMVSAEEQSASNQTDTRVADLRSVSIP